jgi:hypothetical protein
MAKCAENLRALVVETFPTSKETKKEKKKKKSRLFCCGTELSHGKIPNSKKLVDGVKEWV